MKIILLASVFIHNKLRLTKLRYKLLAIKKKVFPSELINKSFISVI
jgi:hypothetical protein